MAVAVAQMEFMHVLHHGAETVSQKRDHDPDEPFHGECVFFIEFQIYKRDGRKQKRHADDGDRGYGFPSYDAVGGRNDERAGNDQRDGSVADSFHRTHPRRGIAYAEHQRVGDELIGKGQLKTGCDNKENKRD